MNKKTIGIIVALLVVLVGLAVIIGSNGDDKTDPKKTTDKTTAITELGEDVDVSGGVEESIFDDGDVEADDDADTPETEETEDSEKPADDDDSDDSDADEDNADAEKPADVNDGEMDYESFHAMDPSDQQKYMESFEDLDAFFDWYNDVKEQYAKENPSIEIDGGPIDLEELD